MRGLDAYGSGGLWFSGTSAPSCVLPFRCRDPQMLQDLPQSETPDSGELGTGVRISPNQENLPP